MSEANELEWSCDRCTFLNSVDDLTCTACYQVRSSTRALPYTWQWLAQVDWIPYDGPSNEQIESAFQAGESKVHLSKGWFAAKKGEYTVHFGRKQMPYRPPAARVAAPAASQEEEEEEAEEDDDDTDDGSAVTAPAAAAAAPVAAGGAPVTVAAYTQVNNHSRMVRKVRRLADDEDMFVTLPPSTIARGTQCSVCAEEWWPEEEEEEAEEQPKVDAAAGAAAPVAASSGSISDHAASASAGKSASAASSSSGAKAATATCLSLYKDDKWPSSEQAAVKLVHCHPGHCFHRSCIASWIKLKDHCPMCKTKI